MTVKDYKNIFRDLCPILVKYNGEVIFDDDAIDLDDTNYDNMLKKYDDFINSENKVKSFEATVVHFHHTILDIKG